MPAPLLDCRTAQPADGVIHERTPLTWKIRPAGPRQVRSWCYGTEHHVPVL